MRKFISITELVVGIVSVGLAIYSNSWSVGAWGCLWLVMAAWSWFLVDWENGWDGRHDSAWILRNKE